MASYDYNKVVIVGAGKVGMTAALECCFLPINNFEALFPCLYSYFL
jgi:hypothetical protein